MAAETIKEFLVGLGFNVDQAGLQRFSSGLAAASAKAMALGAAVTAAAGAVAFGIKKIAEEAEQEARLAERFRTTAAAVDTYLDSMSILGLSSEKATDSLRQLDRAIVDTSMGMGRAAKVFEELGIEATDSNGKLRPTLDVMAELGEKFKGMERGKQLRIMERLGLDHELLYYFNTDLKKLSDEIAEIDKGAGFSFDDWVKESKPFMVMWRNMMREVEKWKMLFSKAIKGVAVRLMPDFRAQLSRMTQGMVDLRRKAMQHIPKIADAFVPALRVLFRVAEAFIRIGMRIGEAVAGIIGWLARVNEATGGWLLWMGAIALAWKKLNLAFLASPIGIVLALAAAVALLVDDFLTWKEGGESLIDWSGTLGDAMQTLIDIVGFLGEAIIQGLGVARDWLYSFFTWIFEQWGEFSSAVDAAVQAVADAGQALIRAWESVKQWFSDFFGAFGRGLETVMNAAGKIGGAIKGVWNRINTPSPSVRSALGGYSANMNQNTTINVSGAGNPQAVAQAVAGQQGRVNADLTRNMRGAVR